MIPSIIATTPPAERPRLVLAPTAVAVAEGVEDVLVEDVCVGDVAEVVWLEELVFLVAVEIFVEAVPEETLEVEVEDR